MAQEPLSSARDVAERAAGVLAPESGLVEDLDAAGLGGAFAQAVRANLQHPEAATRAAARLAADVAQIPLVTATRWLGGSAEPPVQVDPKDRRFADPAWADNPAFYALRLAYLAGSRFAREVTTSAALPADMSAKARLATDLLIDAIAPTNFLPTNPAALKRAFDTAGASVSAGVRQFVDDLLHNQGRPRQVDASGFEVGRNLAATPSKVVYRNELMELSLIHI